MMMSSEEVVILPEDLIFRILSFLPLKSVVRFKTVCKSWRCSIIETSTFAHQHLLHQYEENYSFILLDPHCGIRGIGSNNTTRPKLSLVTPHDTHNFQQQIIFDSPDGCEYSDCTLTISVCNGIICLHTYDGFRYRLYHDKLSISLWNPATNKYTVLPPSPFPPPFDRNYCPISIGFGLDVKNNHYKLVRIFTFRGQGSRVSHVEVYNLTTDSWRIVDAVLPIHVIISDPKSPYRNGTYCWLGRAFPCYQDMYGSNVMDTLICSFDFTDEVFGTVVLPDVDSVKSALYPQLAIIRDDIALINRVHDSHFEIWALKEYGVRESWTKIFKIGPFLWPKLLGISWTGHNLLFVNNNQLCMYDLLTQETKNLQTQGSSLSLRTLEVAIYNESLVGIERGNGAAN
ncbi:hypothetical protein ACHQM5_012058 [Ranunculus cassubicifolius]